METAMLSMYQGTLTMAVKSSMTVSHPLLYLQAESCLIQSQSYGPTRSESSAQPGRGSPASRQATALYHHLLPDNLQAGNARNLALPVCDDHAHSLSPSYSLSQKLHLTK